MIQYILISYNILCRFFFHLTSSHYNIKFEKLLWSVLRNVFKWCRGENTLVYVRIRVTRLHWVMQCTNMLVIELRLKRYSMQLPFRAGRYTLRMKAYDQWNGIIFILQLSPLSSVSIIVNLRGSPSYYSIQHTRIFFTHYNYNPLKHAPPCILASILH